MNMLRQALVDPEVAAEMISSGACLAIAADESLFARLPRGNWIGGTIPYFMSESGGSTTRQKVFVSRLDTYGLNPEICQYDAKTLSRVCLDGPDNGYSLIILPAFSEVHVEYARNAPTYEDMYIKPVCGWISGKHLEDAPDHIPKVINGRTGDLLDNQAIVLHVSLPDNVSVNVSILNLFSPGDGDVLQFDTGSFVVGRCLINGQPGNFAEYLKSIDHDLSLPLVADYQGASINVSFKSINENDKKVELYAPVYPHMSYRLARPFDGSYESVFSRHSAGLPEASFSCNCILNYLYSELEGKHTGGIVGPMSFGEIAYQLLNQTMVHMTLEQH
ncbi:DUF6976 family protein [Undibacterium sp. SXout7W]|uniref:DUF6976 family protein n=1 Tax=Undibacterium sp. SXout7W TaxID=3413049 RepID=UPI003BF425D3